MARLVMNQLQFEFGVIPTRIDKDRKAEYIEALVRTRESDNPDIFRRFMFEEHCRNMERSIEEYLQSVDQQISATDDVPVNVPVKLTERQQRLLQLMHEDTAVTICKLSEILQVTERTIRRDITALKEQHRLVRLGSDKNGRWKVC